MSASFAKFRNSLYEGLGLSQDALNIGQDVLNATGLNSTNQNNQTAQTTPAILPNSIVQSTLNDIGQTLNGKGGMSALSLVLIGAAGFLAYKLLKK